MAAAAVPPTPKFIAIEGPDGVGKTTQVQMLAEEFLRRGMAVEIIRFPKYDTDTGQVIDAYLCGKTKIDPLTLHALFFANRAEQQHLIESRLSAGVVVIADRYSLSGVVYGVAMHDLPLEWCVHVEEPLRKPDLTVVLGMDPYDAIARRDGVPRSEIAEESLHRNVACAFENIVVEEKDRREMGVEDARRVFELTKRWLALWVQDMSKEDVHHAIVKEVFESAADRT
jgi:dTMP kinase